MKQFFKGIGWGLLIAALLGSLFGWVWLVATVEKMWYQ